MRRPLSLRLLAAAAALVAAPAFSVAQPVRVANARVEHRSASAGLAQAFRDVTAAQRGPAWVGWSVAMAGEHHMCCYGSMDQIEASPHSGRCFLENDHRNTTFVNSRDGDCADCGGSPELLVLLRIEGESPRRLRTFSSDCALDVGGLPLIWLSDVRSADSIAFLDRFIGDESLESKKPGKRGEPVLGAIAMHDDPAADPVLQRYAAPSNPESMRKQAIFWLGNSRGRRGYEALMALLSKEESPEVRRHFTFAFSQSNVPEATQTLIGMARKDPSASVRGQALFWLAQKAGRKAAGTIQDAIRDDPETEVKEKAVFALTQMPDDEGVPLLIDVARKNRNPVVRKKAIFWLGQSKDPRALAFIEEVLTK